MLDNVVFISAEKKVNQLYVYIYPLFSGSPSHLGYHRALSSLNSRFSLVIYFIHSKIDKRAYNIYKGFLGGSVVKNLPAVQETWVQSLGQEDPLEKEVTTHSNILAWRIHGQRSLVGYHPWGHRVRHD